MKGRCSNATSAGPRLGLLMFAASFWLTCAAVAAATTGAIMWQVGVVFGSLSVAALLWLASHNSTVGKCLLTLVGVAAFGVAIAFGMPVLNAALNSGWWLPLTLPLLAAPIVLSAFWWMAAPTAEGRKVLDHIAGFKQYLSITEGQQLDQVDRRSRGIRPRSSRNICLTRSRSASRTTGRKGSKAFSPRPRPKDSRDSPGIRGRAARGAPPRASSTRGLVGCRARSARPPRRPDRAEAVRRAVAAAVVAEGAGNQLRKRLRRRQMLIGSSR